MTRKQAGVLLIIASIFLAAHQIRAAEQKSASNPATEPSEHVPTVTVVYDVQNLIAPIPNFPLSSSPHASAFVGSPQEAGPNGPATPGQGPNQLSGAAHPDNPDPAAAQSRIDELTKLIMETVDRDSWRDAGGSIGNIRPFNGTLVITQTSDAQIQIEKLLAQLGSQTSIMARVSADWLLISPAELKKLLKPQTGQGALQEIDPAAMNALPEQVQHLHAQTLGFSGQTVHVVSGRIESVVTSATPVVSTGAVGYQMDLTNVGAGIALQVTPRVDWKAKSAVVTLYSTYNDPEQTKGTTTIRGLATTRPSDLEEASRAAASLQAVNTVLQELRTTVRLPLGVPVLVGGMTLQPASKEPTAPQLVLILKVTASQQ